MKAEYQTEVAIIGAGPYGLAAAERLRAAGIETCVFGEAMEFWDKQMPKGMLLRSIWSACQIGPRRNKLTLDDYEAAKGVRLPRPIPLDDFVKYGRWFQQQTSPDLDTRRVTAIRSASKGFSLALEDGEEVRARRVVVATGISLFSWRPSQFDDLPPQLASHSVEHRDLGRFAGQRVAVIGGGQCALEYAAILSEAGAEVEVIARQSAIRFLDQKAHWLKSPANPFRPLLYPPTDVGPPILNQIVAAPDLFRRMPRSWQKKIAYRSTRPAGSGWLVDRLRGVPLHASREVKVASWLGDQVRLTLDDESERKVDHVLLATGYRVDVARYRFLTPGILQRLKIVEGYPVLGSGLESSLPGLHFLGAPAAHSYGPLCRFVSGTGFAAQALTRKIKGSRVADADDLQPCELPAEAAGVE